MSSYQDFLNASKNIKYHKYLSDNLSNNQKNIISENTSELIDQYFELNSMRKTINTHINANFINKLNITSLNSNNIHCKLTNNNNEYYIPFIGKENSYNPLLVNNNIKINPFESSIILNNNNGLKIKVLSEEIKEINEVIKIKANTVNINGDLEINGNIKINGEYLNKINKNSEQIDVSQISNLSNVILNQIISTIDKDYIDNVTSYVPPETIYKKLSQNTSENDSFPENSIIMHYGNINNIPEQWLLCDGKNNTPDLSKFFMKNNSNTIYYIIKKN